MVTHNEPHIRGTALIAVLADEHPQRDEWVDEQARNAPGHTGIPITDDTYHGLWRIPVPGQTIVHLYARPEDLDAIRRHGAEPVEPS